MITKLLLPLIRGFYMFNLWVMRAKIWMTTDHFNGVVETFDEVAQCAVEGGKGSGAAKGMLVAWTGFGVCLWLGIAHVSVFGTIAILWPFMKLFGVW